MDKDKLYVRAMSGVKKLKALKEFYDMKGAAATTMDRVERIILDQANELLKD